MMPLWMQVLMYLSLVMAGATLLWTIRQHVLEIQAERKLVRLMAEREEYRPVLHLLERRAEQHGDITFTEYEAIGLRELVRRAAASLPPAEQKQIAQGLDYPTVAGREGYLRHVLSASVWKMQHQS